MYTRVVLVVPLMLLALVLTTIALPTTVSAKSKVTFRTTLSGAAEVPPGDPDGRGKAKITIYDETNTICYKLHVKDIAPATAAHIHFGAAGTVGPVVVPLEAPTDGTAKGCVEVSETLIQNILAHPELYYVNVHNAPYPAGAVRGQLG